jgi:hypothetical protein
MTASGVLWTIAGGAGVGAFIDFYIGKSGQKLVKGWLETWWLRFSYVDARNFGREEALFAVAVMDRVFGRRFFSVRRVCAVTVAAILSSAIPLATTIVRAERAGAGTVLVPSDFHLTYFSVVLIAFSASVTITRTIAAKSANLLSTTPNLNVVMLLALLMAQLLLLVFLSPIISLLLGLVAILFTNGEQLVWIELSATMHLSLNGFWDSLSRPLFFPDLTRVITSGINFEPVHPLMLRPAYTAIGSVLALASSAGRLALTVIFLGSYLLKPLYGVISTLWLRVIESDKPIFTLLFGGAAAAAQGFEAIVRALG